MPANYLIANMACSYKVILPEEKLCEKRKYQSHRSFSYKYK